ncbi:MAG: peptidoglycan DD-metalloendopeptidase family protein, partial [Burkholderiaceae bacterium]
LRTDKNARVLHELTPGRLVMAEFDTIGRLHQVRYTPGLDDDSHLTGKVTRVHVRRVDGELSSEIEPIELVRTSRIASATIENSLFAATGKAGIPDTIASQVADIFGGDVNFERDIRRGDQLRVIYEAMFEPDSLSGEIAGRLLAVELVNRGNTLNALWMDHGDGRGQYYDFFGRSVSKAFLRYPIEYARISSGFTQARMHPLLGRKQAHKGVDFAARPGTKIRASGNGTVEFVGTQRGYGRTIILRHGRKITTLYAHMSRFKANLRKGAVVKRGDVIGYVGSSGMATGPHLHYEFRVNGQHRNPLKIALPEAKPLDNSLLTQHRARVVELKGQFAQLEPVRVANAFE